MMIRRSLLAILKRNSNEFLLAVSVGSQLNGRTNGAVKLNLCYIYLYDKRDLHPKHDKRNT